MSVLRLLMLLLPGLIAGPVAAEDEVAYVYGWVEKGRLLVADDTELKVKLDSGALTSSLHATDIERFERDDEEWVRFTFTLEDHDEDADFEAQEIERRVYRNLRIRSASGETRRPVVLMRLCMGSVVHEEQFGLEDRGALNYPVLLGRRTIQHLGLLDVTRTFLNEPECDDDTEIRLHEDRKPDPDIGDGAGNGDEEESG